MKLQSNQENRENQKYFWSVIVLQRKSQSGLRKLILKQERQLVWFCGQFACPDLYCDWL